MARRRGQCVSLASDGMRLYTGRNEAVYRTEEWDGMRLYTGRRVWEGVQRLVERGLSGEKYTHMGLYTKMGNSCLFRNTF